MKGAAGPRGDETARSAFGRPCGGPGARPPGGRRRTAALRGRWLPRGFTLVEILVALAIVAIALTAGMRALTQATDSAAALKARTLALWVAQNRLAAAQIATPWPAIGSYDGDAEQAGMTFVWKASVTTTPNPAFRRIEIVVAEPQSPGYAIARLTGFLGNPEPNR